MAARELNVGTIHTLFIYYGRNNPIHRIVLMANGQPTFLSQLCVCNILPVLPLYTFIFILMQYFVMNRALPVMHNNK